MQSPKLFLTILSLSLLCNACVEIRDNKKEETPPLKIQEEVRDSLTISERMYFFNGKILNEQSYFREQKELLEAKAQPVKELKLRLQTLRIEKEGVLIIGDNWLHIQTNELISNHGAIITFPEGQKASDERNGRNGGTLFLEAKIAAQGILNVILRGEDGGKGAPGDKPGPELNGKDNNQSGEPGTQHPGVICKYGKAGGPGEEGKQGHQGKTGMNGGDTGTMQIKIGEDKGLMISVEKIPGAYGEGGQGGQGGQGGLNGPRGFSACDINIGARSRAEKGKEGPPGDHGQAGKTQEFCQIIGDKRSCN